MEQLPPDVRELFWENLSEEPNPDLHAGYIATRVLEYGGESAYRWLVARIGRDAIRETVESGRLRRDHERFWRGVLLDA